MENASRALTIAGGVLLAILVASLVIFGWGKISEFLSQRQASKLVEDQAKFNDQLDSYNRVCRGYDIVSLCNKIDDLNAIMGEAERYKSEEDIPMDKGRFTDTGYKKILVFVQMKGVGTTKGRLPQRELDNNEKCGIVELGSIQAKYSLSASEFAIVQQAFSTSTGYIYDLSKYMKYFNGDYADTLDYASIKDSKKAINDLYFVCKGELYDSENGRVFVLLMKHVADANADDFTE